MLNTIKSFPGQVREGLQIVRTANLPESNYQRVVVCAMGGSALAAGVITNWRLAKDPTRPYDAAAMAALLWWLTPQLATHYSGSWFARAWSLALLVAAMFFTSMLFTVKDCFSVTEAPSN